MTGPHGWVNTLANLVIVMGYLLVPALWLPYLPLRRHVQIAGATFFVTCALTHLAMAFGLEHHKGMVVNHVVQAAAVMWFVIGFWNLLRSGYLTVNPHAIDETSGGPGGDHTDDDTDDSTWGQPARR